MSGFDEPIDLRLKPDYLLKKPAHGERVELLGTGLLGVGASRDRLRRLRISRRTRSHGSR